MTRSWFLVAVRDSGPLGRGLFDDAEALARDAERVEILVAGDGIAELFVGLPLPTGSNIRIVVDAHSYRRRGLPPLPLECHVVESDYVAHRLLAPEWKVVWR